MSDGEETKLVESFTKRMRVATRKIHNISDTLVNAKLGLALSDDRVWGEGLLVFYEIFKYLEVTLTRLSKKDKRFAQLAEIIEPIKRQEAFEIDLKFYHGPEFSVDSYEIRESVKEYLDHLKELEGGKERIRLMAYYYHLYMGLLSGGQILRKKKQFTSIFASHGKEGNKVTELGDEQRSIGDLKKEIKFFFDDLDLKKEESDGIVEEGLEVFRYNNEIIRSIEGTGRLAMRVILLNPATLLLVVLFSALLSYMYIL